MKYYEASNAGQQIGGVYFTIVNLAAGTTWGVYATDNADEQKALDELVAKKRIASIDKAYYDDQIAKKKGAPSLNDFSKSSSPPSQPPGPSLKATVQPAVIVEGGTETPEEDAPVEIKQTIESVEEATKTKKVEASPTTTAAPEPKAKKGK